MATKKTLNQILKQNTFSGADVGKAFILNWIEKTTEQKETLSDNELNAMTKNLSGKQITVYKAYYHLQQYLDDFYKLVQANFQQFQNGKRALIGDLEKFSNCQHKYKDYLHLPLVLTEKEYNKIQADALKEFNNDKFDLYTLILWTICDYVESYKENKDIPEAIKAILDSYENETIKIEFENEALKATGETADKIDHEQFIDNETERLLVAFADKYGIEKTHEAISSFISHSFVKKLEENLPAEKILRKDSEKLLKSCEIYEMFKEDEFYYNNEYDLTGTKVKENKTKFESFSDTVEDSYESIIEIEEMSKIEALKTLCSDFLEYYNENSRDKTTAELQQEFIKDFPELYKTTKDILSKGYKPFKTLKDSELLTTEISNKELIKAGLKQPLEENEIKEHTREYFINLESKTTADFIKRHKAQYGGIAVLTTDIPSIFDNDTFKKFCESPFNTLIPDDVIPQRIELYIKNLIEPALYCIYGMDALYDVYSDIFKVDLSKLKIDYDYEEDIYAYNNLVYLIYNRIEGTAEQVKSDKISFKSIFKPLDPERYKPNKDKIQAIKEELSNISIDKVLDLKYFSQILEGANIRYEN